MTRCLLSEANLPQKFRGEAINTAEYFQNRLPTQSYEITPHHLCKDNKANIPYPMSHIKVFGCKAYADINKNQQGKLDEKAMEGIFMGFENRSKIYRM